MRMAVAKTNQINFEIADVFKQLYIDFSNRKYYEYSLSSGRGGAKSTTVARFAVLDVFKGAGNVLYIRRFATSLRDSVYAECVKAIEDMGLSNEFRFSVSPLKITAKNGYAIYFRGLDDPQKVKSFKPAHGHVSMLVYEEMQEISSKDVYAEVNATVARGMHHCSIFYLFNPPPKKSHFVNSDLSFPIKGYRGVYKSSYLQIPLKWIGQQFIKTAESLKESNFTMYQYRYMGVPIGGDELIFENVSLESIPDLTIFEWFVKDQNLYFGMDFGWYPDPTTFNMMYYDEVNRTLYIFAEWQGLKHTETAMDICIEGVSKFITDFMSKRFRQVESFKQLGYRVTGDNDNKAIQNLKELGWNIEPAEKGPGSRDTGFKWLQGLNRIVIDDSRCPKTAEEFTEYHYVTDKNGEVVSLYPEGQADHHMAGVRYALEKLIKYKGV